MKKLSWLVVCLLLCVSAVALPATLAYIIVESPSLVNTFTVPALPSAEEVAVEVRVHKTVLSSGKETIGPQGFHFILENAQTGAQQTITTGVTGYGSLTLAFSEADAGKTHSFRLYEVNDGREKVSYSEIVYNLAIAVGFDAQQNVLTAAPSVNGESVKAILAEFENIYAASSDVPATDDAAPVMLWLLALLLSGGALLLLRRRAK